MTKLVEGQSKISKIRATMPVLSTDYSKIVNPLLQESYCIGEFLIQLLK